MDLHLAGKRVLVTGGSRGIGRAIVLAFAREGSVVMTCARGEEGLVALKADAAGLPGAVRTTVLDVRDGAALAGWVEASAQEAGGLDGAVSNVSARLDAKGDDLWRKTFELDLLQHVRLGEATLPHLRRNRAASLIFLGSIAAVLTRLPPGEEAYGALKAALVNHAAQLAERCGKDGVRVNVVSPGPILFPGGVWDQIRTARPPLFDAAAALAALRRHGTPEEVADTVAFLASPRASYITGVNLRIDGGAVKAANF
jgi:NAD(P)-dependent dehydrogenase (short-subunit alcohol dehydrogenase family)